MGEWREKDTGMKEIYGLSARWTGGVQAEAKEDRRQVGQRKEEGGGLRNRQHSKRWVGVVSSAWG